MATNPATSDAERLEVTARLHELILRTQGNRFLATDEIAAFVDRICPETTVCPSCERRFPAGTLVPRGEEFGCAECVIRSLEMEIERFTQINLGDIRLDGALRMKLSSEVFPLVAKALLAMFIECKGTNFVEWIMKVPDEPDLFILTVQRQFGKTPAQLLDAAKQRLTRAENLLATFRDHIHTPDVLEGDVEEINAFLAERSA